VVDAEMVLQAWIPLASVVFVSLVARLFFLNQWQCKELRGQTSPV
jgi:hypothetical protein